jgi:hypothetical protein
MKNFEKDFKKWLLDDFFAKGKKPSISHKLNALSFKNISASMQWGVYVDFFDSVGVYLEDIYLFQRQGFISYVHDIPTLEEDDNLYKTRHEARKAALEKAMEIYEKL